MVVNNHLRNSERRVCKTYFHDKFRIGNEVIDLSQIRRWLADGGSVSFYFTVNPLN